MSITTQAGTTLPIEQFWKWLQMHSNCIIRAATPECCFYDHDHLHWQLAEEPNSNLIVQQFLGKQLIAEMVIETREVLFVQVTPDNEGDEGQFQFELIAGSKNETYTVGHFLMAHGYEEESLHHGQLKQ